MAEKEGDYVSRADYDRLMADLEATRAALEEQLSLNDEASERIKTLEPFEGQTKDLSGKLRNLSHKQAYDALADELKIKKEFKDDVWDLAKYEAKADEPDLKAMKEHLGKFLENRKGYTGEESKGSGSSHTKLPKGEGADRGGGSSGGDGKFRITSKQANDVEFMDRNRGKIATASREGNFEIVDDAAI